MLREKGAKFEEVDLNKGLPVAELEKLIGKRDYKDFLNTRNDLYREREEGSIIVVIATALIWPEIRKYGRLEGPD